MTKTSNLEEAARLFWEAYSLDGKDFEANKYKIMTGLLAAKPMLRQVYKQVNRRDVQDIAKIVLYHLDNVDGIIDQAIAHCEEESVQSESQSSS